MRKFLGRHPFADSLVKRIVRIVVTWNVVLLCIFGLFIPVIILGFLAGDSSDSQPVSYKEIYGTGDSELLSIPVRGVIMGTSDGGSLGSLFGGDAQTYGYDIKDQLYAAADDDTVKGVVLEIDSPGGTIYGAHAIADGVAHYKQQTHRPVYAHISGTGASGAYWAAASADKIYADYGSDIGSIGVIMGPFEYYDKVLSTDGGILGGGVMTENGIQTTTITAGRSKDVGNPYRKLTADEIKTLQTSVNNEYDNFVAYISQQRAIPDTTIRGTIGAMAYEPKTALQYKLIDKIGNRQDAYDALAEAAHVKDSYHVSQTDQSGSLMDAVFGAISRKPAASVKAPDLCALTRSPLAYHGDVSAWCNTAKQ